MHFYCFFERFNDFELQFMLKTNNQYLHLLCFYYKISANLGLGLLLYRYWDQNQMEFGFKIRTNLNWNKVETDKTVQMRILVQIWGIIKTCSLCTMIY